ncbi:hypothetical protein [Microcoleus sp. bin38.metabat.b11b12b14.051]|nr:hypothetical protein [Microcoleus sp. bin38.metabat.b11b12b14.051]
MCRRGFNRRLNYNIFWGLLTIFFNGAGASLARLCVDSDVLNGDTSYEYY